MHDDEFWQEYNLRGMRVLNGGLSTDVGLAPGRCYSGVSIMLYRFNNGEVEYLFQKRSEFVRRNAGKWDVSAGGHINYKESALDAIVREASEEIGVRIDAKKVEFAAKYLVKSDRIVYLYFYDVTGEEMDFHFDDKEVERVKWVKYKDCKEFMKQATFKDSLKSDGVFGFYFETWSEKIRKKYENL